MSEKLSGCEKIGRRLRLQQQLIDLGVLLIVLAMAGMGVFLLVAARAP